MPRKHLLVPIALAFVVAVVACSDDPSPVTAGVEAPPGVDAAGPGGDAASLVDGAVPGDSGVVDASHAADDAADAAVAYTGAHVWSKQYDAKYVSLAPNGETYFSNGASLTKLTTAGTVAWTKALPAGVTALSIAASGSGVYVSGSFTGTVDFGGGPLTGPAAFVVKLDAVGGHVWSRPFVVNGAPSLIATVGGDVAIAGAITSGSVDLGGGSVSGSMFVARLAGATGAHVWSRAPAAGRMNAHDMKGDAAGNIVLAGELNSSVDWGGGVDTSAGISDVYAVKLGPSGAAAWTKRVGDERRQAAYGVAMGPAGEVYLTGGMAGTLDFGAGPIVATNPTVPVLVTTFVAKLSPGGAGVWAKVYSTAGERESYGNSIASDAMGNVVVAGTTQSALDFGGGPLPAREGTYGPYVVKLDGAGAHLWSKGWAPGVSMNGSGDSVGAYAGTDATGATVFAARLAETTTDFGGGPFAGGADPITVLVKYGP